MRILRSGNAKDRPAKSSTDGVVPENGNALLSRKSGLLGK